ncbi:MAG: ABC transporter permease [Legionellales bacterium]|nr:ABC transporter permease [Legionellales bacterium]OUX67762.1 MAG: hypothetical protein CBD38_01985 [bacterium TMED178]|tara:strand:+ start:1995 stop:2756 length:762 start_codon:yes stop_codon:yes gene_type:complete
MILLPLRTLMYKEIYRFLRLWRQTLIPTVISSSLFMMIFGKVLGDRIGSVQNIDYPSFIFPGLMMLSMIISSFQNTASSFYGEKFQKSIEEILVSPLSNVEVIIGFLTGGVVRGCICGVLVTIVGIIITGTPIAHPVIFLMTMLLVTTFFAAIGMINGMLAKTFDHITVFPDFILTPLIFLSGIFYSTDQLPEILRPIHAYNPIVYFVDAARYSILNLSEFTPVGTFVVIIAMLVVVLSALGYLFNRGLGFRE